jgi:hypothetical protein
MIKVVLINTPEILTKKRKGIFWFLGGLQNNSGGNA